MKCQELCYSSSNKKWVECGKKATTTTWRVTGPVEVCFECWISGFIQEPFNQQEKDWFK